MKRFILALGLALILTLTLAPATFARHGGSSISTEVTVEVSVISVTVMDMQSGTDIPYLGALVHVSGTVTAYAEANVRGLLSFAQAMVEAGYSITAPDGTILGGDTITDFDSDFGFLRASAEAGMIVLAWSIDFELDQIGTYILEQYGLGSTIAARFLRVRYTSEAESAIYALICHPRPWYETQIMFIMNYGHTRYYDMDSQGVLGEEIDSAGRFGASLSDQYMIVVPEGTTMLRVDGVRPKCLYVNVIDPDGTPHATNFMPVLFSQPYTVYKMEGFLVRPSNTFTSEWWQGTGRWVPVYTGTIID